MDKIKQAICNWKRSREATIYSLRMCAKDLGKSHDKNAGSEYDSAYATFVGDLVGLGGVFLAPFSGGLSLAAVGVSSTVGIGSYINKRGANNEDEKTRKEVQRKVDTAIEQDKRASESLNNISEKFVILENQLSEMHVDDMILYLQKRTNTEIKVKAKEIRTGDIEKELQQSKDAKMPGGVFRDLTITALNLNAALTSAEKVVKYTKSAKEVYTGTKIFQQVVSTAESVNTVTQTAKLLAEANQAAVITIKEVKSVAQSSVAFASVARGVDGVVKTAGVVSSATGSARAAVDIVTASGQAISHAKTVTAAAKVGTVISTATKGADTTIKTVKNIKQASNTVKTVYQVAADSGKAIRTTRITTNAARMTKVSETATKAASISKVGLAINAVVIPLDIYNVLGTSRNLYKSYDDVKRIEELANSLEKEMNEITEEIECRCEIVNQLHVQLFKIYNDHHEELIFEYLELMHTLLDFDIPLRK